MGAENDWIPIKLSRESNNADWDAETAFFLKFISLDSRDILACKSDDQWGWGNLLVLQLYDC